jgi:hypothetical protein
MAPDQLTVSGFPLFFHSTGAAPPCVKRVRGAHSFCSDLRLTLGATPVPRCARRKAEHKEVNNHANNTTQLRRYKDNVSYYQ